MSTYFGYVEREADNYINWADVSKNIITTVDDINRVREEKKQALDDDYRAALKELTLQPKGKDEEANKYITEYADNASNFLMMQNRLLKEGKIKVKDYINIRQNLGDGTDNLFKIMKDYQTNYGAFMDAYKEGKISAASLWNLKQVEKFADFSKSGAYIAADGSVMQAMKTKKIVNGQEIYTLDTNPGEVASMSVLLDTVNSMINRYDVNAKTTELAKAAGTYIQSMYVNGQIASIEDITALKYGQDPLETTETLRNAIADLNTNEKNEFVISEDLVKKTKKTALGNETEVAQMYKSAKAKAADQLTDADKKVINFVETKLSGLIEKSKGPKVDFYKSETKMILAAMPQPEDIMSVLVDNKQFASNGLEYDFRPIDDVDKVDQLTKENPNIIYMANVKGRSVPVLSKAQKEEAVEYMREIVRAKYTLKEVDRGTTSKVDVAQTTTPKVQLTEEDKKRGEKFTETIQEANFLAQMHSGSKREIETAMQHYINRSNGTIVGFIRDPRDITVKYNDGSTAKMRLYDDDDKPISLHEFIIENAGLFHEADKFNFNQVLSKFKNTLQPNISSEVLTQSPTSGLINAAGLKSTEQKEQEQFVNKVQPGQYGVLALPNTQKTSAGKGSGAAAAGGKAR